MKIFILFFLSSISLTTFAQQAVDCNNATTGVNFTFTTVNTGKFVASTFIVATNQVSNVEYYAAQSVSLQNGFKATSTTSTQVKAAIGTCIVNEPPSFATTETNSSFESIDKDVMAYPVPANTEVTLSWQNQSFRLVQMIDMFGKVIYEQKLSSDSLSHKIPLHSFATGLYVVQLQDNQGRLTTKKVIKRIN
jgi:hypothetical protein